jgi:hypothetical protein
LSRKTLTSIIPAITLIALTIATTIPATSPAGSVNTSFSKTEDMQITGCMWAPDSSYANITLSNFGADTVSINEVRLDGAALAGYSFVSGDSVVDAGESVTIQVSGLFSRNVSYQFCVVTSGGAEFVFAVTAPEPSATSRVESEATENAADGVIQADLDYDVPADSSEFSNQSDVFVEDSLEPSVELPTTRGGYVYSGSVSPEFFALDVLTQQYLADVAARKELLLNYSALQQSEGNGETGLIWEPIDVQGAFHVRQTGGYWEAIQEDTQLVAFGGSEAVGGVKGSDGGAVLNAAIDAASVAGGGRVTVGCGVLFADSIAPKSFVDLCGEGEATVLRQNADANTIFIHSAEKIVNFSMHDLTIDYNHQSQSSPKEGMYIGYASEYLHFYRLWIRNCKKFGIHLASLNQPNDPPISCENVKVEDIVFTDVVAENWDLCVVASHGGCIRNVTIYGMHRNGGIVAFEGTNLLVTDCHVTIDCQDGEIIGGIWLGSCNYSVCANNTVVGQTMYGIYETIGIRVNTEHDNMKPRDSYRNMVTDNYVSNILHGIMLEETSDDYVVFNTLTDCANGIVFPSYGYPAASDSKIFFNSLNNVACPIREFIIPLGMLQFFNIDGSTTYLP